MKNGSPPNWQAHIVQDVALPILGDANGNPVTFQHEVRLCVVFSNALYHIRFLAAGSIPCPVLFVAQFMHRNVDAMWCFQRRGHCKLGEILIITQINKEAPWIEVPAAQ